MELGDLPPRLPGTGADGAGEAAGGAVEAGDGASNQQMRGEHKGGVGLYLRGRDGGKRIWSKPPVAEKWLSDVADWISQNCQETLVYARQGQDSESRPTLFVSLHPSAEDVEFVGEAPGRLIVSAKTSTTGAGYHICLCDVLKRLGSDLHVTWEPPDEKEGSGDETGYFHGRDAEAVIDEMYRWLGHLAQVLLEEMGDECRSFSVSMPLGPLFEWDDDHVLTPMGPRAVSWLQAVA